MKIHILFIKFIFTFQLALILAFSPLNCIACCMLQKGLDASIRQNEQQGIIFFQNGVEDLILGIDYQIEGKEIPSEFAWIISVPTKPTKYALADKGIFKTTNKWAHKLTYVAPRTIAFGDGVAVAPSAGSLEFGKRERVGPYDIQPIKALGMEALDGLNEWLTQNGFPTETTEHMSYFIKNGFTFLCIKVNTAEKGKPLNKTEAIKPLQITFNTSEIYYPLKYSSRQGNFELNLITLSSTPLDYERSGMLLDKMRYSRDRKKNVVVKGKDLPEELYEAVKRFDMPIDDVYLNVFRSRGFNKDMAIAAWEMDMFISLKD